jgi:long-chain acyl-CoA synthetase
MFIRMLKLPIETRQCFNLESHKVAIHAAAPCPQEVKRKMIDWWGPIIHEYYSGSEQICLCCIDSAQWLDNPGSVGQAVFGIPHILDESGNELGPGEEGCIYFSDGQEFSYHNDREKTASSRNEKGWSTLGDIGYLNEKGFLFLTDRKANLIISGGVNIYPQECENLLVTHHKVLDVAVFGVPNPDFGEEVKAVVQPLDIEDAGPDLIEELMSFCKKNLSPIKCPRSIDFKSELPRHSNGKLFKRILKAEYLED